ncbi:hypothetical protein BC832DRAFT_553787 [Gaertneriomyces semiglobifer]|nr:hypothetical protein BC832DRAFT_553787 [Gaertneriomyces semiglobifer]
MWVLVGKAEATHEQRIWLRPAQSYSCGRKDAMVLLPNDKSVSRAHCTLTVGGPVLVKDLSNLTLRTEVRLVDQSSKFGTYILHNRSPSIEAEKISGSVVLKEGDCVRFGVNDSIFQLQYSPIVVCCSGMRSAMRAELNDLARQFDMKSLKNWDQSCTHLVVTSPLRATMKLVLAVASARNVVDDTWIRDFARIDPTHFSIPSEEQFTPKLEDLPDVSLLPDRRRATALSGHQFIIFSENLYDELRAVVTAASGEIYKRLPSAQETKDSLQSFLSQYPRPCLVSPEAGRGNRSHDYSELIMRVANSMNLKTITQDDIARAILYNDPQKYCNPFVSDAESQQPASQSPPPIRTKHAKPPLTDPLLERLPLAFIPDSVQSTPTPVPDLSAGASIKGFDDFLEDLMSISAPKSAAERHTSSQLLQGTPAEATTQPQEPQNENVADTPRAGAILKAQKSLAETLGLMSKDTCGPAVEQRSCAPLHHDQDKGAPEMLSDVNSAVDSEFISRKPSHIIEPSSQREVSPVAQPPRSNGVAISDTTVINAFADADAVRVPNQESSRRRKRHTVDEPREALIVSAIRAERERIKTDAAVDEAPIETSELGLMVVEEIRLISRMDDVSREDRRRNEHPICARPNFKKFKKVHHGLNGVGQLHGNASLTPARIIAVEPYERDKIRVVGDDLGWGQHQVRTASHDNPRRLSSRANSNPSTQVSDAFSASASKRPWRSTRAKRPSPPDDFEDNDSDGSTYEDIEEDPFDFPASTTGTRSRMTRVDFDEPSQEGFAAFTRQRPR